MTRHVPDWDPTSVEVLRDQVAAYDELRRRCPVAHSELLGWSLFRHEDVAAVLADPGTFSNVVSTHRSVPNGMDPPEHTAFRAALEPCFAPDAMGNFEPVCRRIAEDLLASIPAGVELDFMGSFAVPFASQCQCAFLGWSEELAAPLRDWTRRNREAILAADRPGLARIASEFEARIVGLLAQRRQAGSAAPVDVTGALLQVRVGGQPLTDAELTSIFRNWTVGEVGSIAAALGLLVSHIASSPALRRRLREEPAVMPAAIEELLRLEGPLVSNRRRTTRDVSLGGRRIAAGERVSLMWVSANRDPEVFDEPGSVRLERQQGNSLLWGAGLHVCPGAPLARLELRIALEAVLANFEQISPGSEAPTRLCYPENGWAWLPVKLG